MSQIDLSKLPPPDLLLQTTYETLMQEQLEALALIDPVYAASIAVGDPGYNVLLAVAYVRMLDRQRFNEAGRGVMLAYAAGADLDGLGALMNVTRAVIDPGDENAVPPIDATLETDDAFRARIVLAPEGFATAGSIGAYKFHALAAGREVISTTVEQVSSTEIIIRKMIEPAVDEAVKDASVQSPTPGDVLVTVLGYDGNGVPSAGLLDAVENALSADAIRPVADNVIVQAATILTYVVTATLYFLPGIDRALVLAQAQAALEAYVSDAHQLGRRVSLSGILAALHQNGVDHVTMTAPSADITPTLAQAAKCTAMTLTDGGAV